MDGESKAAEERLREAGLERTPYGEWRFLGSDVYVMAIRDAIYTLDRIEEAEARGREAGMNAGRLLERADVLAELSAHTEYEQWAKRRADTAAQVDAAGFGGLVQRITHGAHVGLAQKDDGA